MDPGEISFICMLNAGPRFHKEAEVESNSEIAGRPAPFATSYMIGRENKRTNNETILPAVKNNAVAGYNGPVKLELLKGAGLLK